jgi:hypothetical protein
MIKSLKQSTHYSTLQSKQDTYKLLTVPWVYATIAKKIKKIKNKNKNKKNKKIK